MAMSASGARGFARTGGRRTRPRETSRRRRPRPSARSSASSEGRCGGPARLPGDRCRPPRPRRSRPRVSHHRRVDRPGLGAAGGSARVSRRAHARKCHPTDPGRGGERSRISPTVRSGAVQRGRGPDEAHDGGGQLLAGVLLEEVAGALDRGVRLALGAGDHLLCRTRSAPAVIGSLVAEGAQERLRPAPSTSQAARLGAGGRVVGRCRHEQSGTGAPRLVGVVGEGRVVGRDDLAASGRSRSRRRRSGRRGTPASPGRTAPREERLARRPVAGRQERVGRDDARRSGRVLGRRAAGR